MGRLLTFGGRIGSAADLVPLQAAADRYGHTALGAALRLTLVSQRLRPAIDPLTGMRPVPELGDARELLQDTCTDSGVAALKRQLLQRHAGALPDGLTHPAETGFTAWDGTTSMRGDAIATYSDETLQPWGPTLHFCFDESRLRAPVRAAARRLARQLRREQPARIVIVGHGDYAGTCRYNDGLALRRAESLRRILVDAGIRPQQIQVASLGERRPLDFSATAEAHELNRRVELLVEPASTATAQSEPQRVLPKCTAPVPGRVGWTQ
jgi:outer membrane protein OmpA-like peptidoglycan-associated protein